MGVWLRDLPAALDGWGLTVTQEPGWQARGHGPLLRSPRGVGCHWTATPHRLAVPFPTTRVVRDGRPGLAGPLANLMLGFDGSVKIVAAGLAYHFGAADKPRAWGMSGNADVIGIECEGDGTWTAAQLGTYPRLCAALWRWYADVKLANVIAHAEWAPSRKIDIHTWPGGMDDFRLLVSEQNKENAVDQAQANRIEAMLWEVLRQQGGNTQRVADNPNLIDVKWDGFPDLGIGTVTEAVAEIKKKVGA